MTDPANALAASSLLLTVLTLLFTVWSEPLRAARTATFGADIEERPAQREPVRTTLHRRAFPLAVGSWLVAGIFFPRTACILKAIPDGFGHLERYDDVLAGLAVSELFLIWLALATTFEAAEIRHNLVSSWR